MLKISAIVWTTRCTPSKNDGDLHCGDYDNMTCNDVHYVPYCHPLRNTNEGICTCEKGKFVIIISYIIRNPAFCICKNKGPIPLQYSLGCLFFSPAPHPRGEVDAMKRIKILHPAPSAMT